MNNTKNLNSNIFDFSYALVVLQNDAVMYKSYYIMA